MELRNEIRKDIEKKAKEVLADLALQGFLKDNDDQVKQRFAVYQMLSLENMKSFYQGQVTTEQYLTVRGAIEDLAFENRLVQTPVFATPPSSLEERRNVLVVGQEILELLKGTAYEEIMSKLLHMADNIVETPLGELYPIPFKDNDFPGIYVYFKPKGENFEEGIALTEYTSTDKALRVLGWDLEINNEEPVIATACSKEKLDKYLSDSKEP